MLCLRIALMMSVATLSLADVDVTTPLSPSTPPELPIGADLIPEYEDLSDKQQTPSTPPPDVSILNVGDTLWTCDCDFKEFLAYVRTKSSQDATTLPEIRCQGAEGVLEVWSDAAALKYCPEQDYDDSSSEEYDDEYEDIAAAEETDVAVDEAAPMDDLPKVTTDLLQETSEPDDEVAVTEDVDATPDVAYVEEEIVVYYGVPGSTFGLGLVLMLAALTAIAVAVAVAVWRSIARRDLGRRGWTTLEEEGDAAYVKVPLESS